MVVTKHALKRFLQRTGKYWDVETKIQDILLKGREVKPKDYLIRVINNGFEQTKYYHYNNLVAVIVDDAIIKTVMLYEKGKWKKVDENGGGK